MDGVRIVAAALKRGDLVYSAPPPARHHTLMHEVDRQFGDKHQPFTPDEQGFLGSDGEFYDRRKAAKLALLAEQATAVLNGRLYSEDLW